MSSTGAFKRLVWDKFILGGVAARLLLGGVFVYASIDKIWHPDQFAEILVNYKLLPVWAINVMAIILPWLEVTAGALLIVGVWPRENATILGGLLLVFIVAIGVNLARGLDFNCGCFSTASSHKNASIMLLVRDALLLIPAIQLIWFVRRRSLAETYGQPARVNPV